MSFDVTQSVQQVFTDFMAKIFSSDTQAIQFLDDPTGTLAAEGLTDQDLSNLNVQQAVVDACDYPGVPASVKQNLESYSAPSYTAQTPTIENIVQQVTQVTQVVHNDNSEVTNHIVNNDNRTDINVEGDFDGDIDIDNENNTTIADRGGVANSGDGDVTAATGANSNAVSSEGGDIGNVNSGDGAVQAGEDITAPVNTGINSGVINDGDIDAPVVLGPNSGIVADGDVEDSVVGDGNQTANVDGPADEAVFNFGSGDVNQANDNTVTDGAVSADGDATNVSNNQANDGGAISTGGDATGDQDFNSETTTVTDSTDVNTEQGEGDLSDDDEADFGAREINPL